MVTRYLSLIENPQTYIGKRVEIPVHYNAWARGARFGEVLKVVKDRPGISDYLVVKLDKQVKPIKLWRIDWLYTKLVDESMEIWEWKA